MSSVESREGAGFLEKIGWGGRESKGAGTRGCGGGRGGAKYCSRAEMLTKRIFVISVELSSLILDTHIFKALWL